MAHGATPRRTPLDPLPTEAVVMDDDTQTLNLPDILALLAAEHDGEPVMVLCPVCGAHVPGDLIALHRLPLWQQTRGMCGV